VLPEQCLEAIDRLDVRIAHLGVAHWLHIHRLYETSAGDVGDRGSDDFYDCHCVDRDQALEGYWMSPQRSSPRKIQKASVTRRTGRYAGGTASGSDSRSTTKKNLDRLRHTEERLQLLINQWELGVLCLYSTGFTDNLYHNRNPRAAVYPCTD